MVLNQKEKKAIEILDTFELRRKTKNYKEISLEDTQSVKIVLNLIEKLINENNRLVQEYKHWINKDILLEKIEKLCEEGGCWDYDYYNGIAAVMKLVQDNDVKEK